MSRGLQAAKARVASQVVATEYVMKSCSVLFSTDAEAQCPHIEVGLILFDNTFVKQYSSHDSLPDLVPSSSDDSCDESDRYNAWRCGSQCLWHRMNRNTQ